MGRLTGSRRKPEAGRLLLGGIDEPLSDARGAERQMGRSSHREKGICRAKGANDGRSTEQNIFGEHFS